MAAETTPAPVNGTYHAHHQQPNPYAGDPYNQAHAAANNAHPATHSHAPQTSQESRNEIAKDEVGWFFVEQYYTTLSRSPEKLHLFYSRRSQFVSGVEAEKVTVAVGQKAIHERIKELDFQECKVRVLNVDSQASFDNILVTVIGEISNKCEPPRKFVQTFVLAEQPNGYYVLNDIIRYLADEDEEIVDEVPAQTGAVEGAPAATEVPAPQQPEPVEHQVDTGAAVQEVDEKLEEAVVNGDLKPAAEEKQEQAQEQAAPAATPAAAPVPVIPASAEVVHAERPKTPEPTPVASPPKPKAVTPAAAEKEPAPAKPASMTWASIASSRAGAPAPATAAATPAAPVAQPKPAPVAAPATASTSAAPQPAAQLADSSEKVASRTSSSAGSEWQTAGAEHNKRQARPQSVSGPGGENASAYIKNVTDKVDVNLLRQTLSRFGKVVYFDVSKERACAFAEFADPAAYKAAVAANPHQVGTEQLVVEERHRRPGSYGGPGYGPGRGGRAGRGRGDRSGSQGRGGFQKDSGRFPPRGRGGNITPKGRSQPQPA